MHVFKYSPRSGTVAAKMTNQIDGNVKEERSNKLIELSDKNEKEYNQQYIGKEVEVLLEEISRSHGSCKESTQKGNRGSSTWFA